MTQPLLPEGHIVNMGDNYVPDERTQRIIGAPKVARQIGSVAGSVAGEAAHVDFHPSDLAPVQPLPESLTTGDTYLAPGHIATGGRTDVRRATQQ